jgi:hypothetical protein
MPVPVRRANFPSSNFFGCNSRDAHVSELQLLDLFEQAVISLALVSLTLFRSKRLGQARGLAVLSELERAQFSFKCRHVTRGQCGIVGPLYQ